MTTIIGTGEVGALHSREELEEMQRLPLQRKIQITTARIIEWYQHYDGKVYVAFSGGKDSTVLLDIVRRIYPDVPAVFSDTGLEFPEVREFVKSCENVTIVRPEMNFRKVIEVYGYPVVSKRVANTVEYGHKPGSFRWKELHGEIMRSNGTPSEFNCKKWCYLLDAPFKVSSRCCTIMKKQPMKKYSKETGRVPIIATMANESRSRRATWLRMGCNAFSGKKPSSQPMSFWTEEDVLEYLYKTYGKRFRIEGFYPFSVMENVTVDPAEYIDSACYWAKGEEAKRICSELKEMGVEPWVSNVDEDGFFEAVALGCTMVTHNDPAKAMRWRERL